MKAKNKIFVAFLVVSALFIIGSIFKIRPLALGAGFFVVPILILYYRIKARTWYVPIVAALFLFYVRDIFLLWDLSRFAPVVMISFLAGALLFLILILTGFERSRVHPVEYISLIIMYAFLGFILYTVGELVPQVIPSHRDATYLYLFLLVLLMALGFTQYLLKSHYASLWTMLAAASLLISELSLFFKLYVIEDVSVTVFFPVFHVFAFYSLVQHGLHRRKSSWLPYF